MRVQEIIELVEATEREVFADIARMEAWVDEKKKAGLEQRLVEGMGHVALGSKSTALEYTKLLKEKILLFGK